MTFYEELGVSPKASIEEIRESYRQLARLLHPDRTSDESARRLAEIQMKRLNAIVALLTHADKRRAYDASLGQQESSLGCSVPLVAETANSAARMKPGPSSILRWLTSCRHPNIAWLLAGAAVAMILLWALRTGSLVEVTARSQRLLEVEQHSKARAPASATPLAKASRDIENLELQLNYWRKQAEKLRAERDAAAVHLSRLESTLGELTARLNRTPETTCSFRPEVQPLAPAASKESILSAPNTPPLATRSLAGNWYYLRSSDVAALRDDLYPPEYIEARISEEAGLLKGRYRARYRILDRTISPEVVFHFTGQATGESARLPWVGPSGAKGEVRLRLLTPDSMEITWIAFELGTTLGLGSGSATLIRRHEP
ncbi:MAG: DnaJ domain-containing protein [Bryobacteraceae bacterium]|nr:DnaJ domain-containing protein [Bryobacteraceae bacterium]MDW8378212.1 DnaJ domain-containing protein [Bryobacterales bacterium]